MPRALVTGADGFIGSHLVELLHAEGYEVRALALYNSFNSWGWLDGLKILDDIEVVTGDVRDARSCAVATKDVDVVFHLASLIAIPYSYVAVDSYVETNVRGTANVCRAAMENGVSRVLHTSTSEVYGTALTVPIDESHPLQPQSPYSASKIGADALAMSFHFSFGLPVSIARPFNTYGPRQSARAVIPTIIMQLAAGERAVQLGDVRPRRDFNYVGDTCRGMLSIVESSATVGGTFNIGSGLDWSVAEVFEIIRDLMGVEATIALDDARLRPETSEVYRLQSDPSHLRETTGFRSAISLADGLERTIEWFNAPDNLARYKTGIYNV